MVLEQEDRRAWWWKDRRCGRVSLGGWGEEEVTRLGVKGGEFAQGITYCLQKTLLP